MGMPTVFDTQPQQQPDLVSGTIPPSQPVRPSRHDRMTLFTAFAENPEGVRFETQADEEKVVIFMREHFSFNIPWILALALLLAAPFGVIPFILAFLVPYIPPIPPQYYLVGVLFWYLASFGYGLLNFIRWYYNIYIVTTERVIDIDFVQLLYKKLSEARLTKIEDVTYTSSGFLATFFNYGNVTIQTAGETEQFEFTAIPNPAEVVKVLGSLIKKAGPEA